MGVAAQSRDLLLAEEDTLMFIWTLTFLTLALIAVLGLVVVQFTNRRRRGTYNRLAQATSTDSQICGVRA